MATKMQLTQQRSFTDNSKGSFKFNENSRSRKIIPDLKCQDKNTVSYLDDFTSITPLGENIGDFEKLTNKTLRRPDTCEKIGRFCNAKLEKRYRTNSTDSAFSEESFIDFDGDENTKLESWIDQLIFTDDRLNSDISTYAKTDKMPSTDPCALDVGDLFNNTDILTVDFDSLVHESPTSSCYENETWPDSENPENTSSISSSDNVKLSIHKYLNKKSMFPECSSNKVSNSNNNLSSGSFISTEEDKVVECDDSNVNKPIVSSQVDGNGRADGCVNDCIHECSFVDLSTLFELSPYGSPFSVGENLPLDVQKHLNTDDDGVCVPEPNFSDAYSIANTTRSQLTPTKDSMSSPHIETTKSNNGNNNTSNSFQKEVPLTEVRFWPEEDKLGMSLSSVKDCPVKSMDISDCDEHSQESLFLYSLENLCGYGDQEMSGINQNNNGCNFLPDTYDDSENRCSFEKTPTIESTNNKKLLISSEDASSKIAFSNQRDTKDGNDNGTNLLNINDSVVCFGDNTDTLKLESYFPEAEFSNDDDEDANMNKAQTSPQDTLILSNEDHIKGVVAKDHSYRALIPAQYKEINMPIIETKEKSNRTYQLTDSPVKHNPAKRQLVEDSNSPEQELLISKENSLKSVCSSAKAEFPGLKFLLQEESFSAIDSVLQTSSNNNYYPCDHSDDSSCIQKKMPKLSIEDNVGTRVQPAILYQVLSKEQNSPSAFIPVKSKVKNLHYSRPQNNSDFKRHYSISLREETMPIRMKDERSEMKELEKYLRGIIPNGKHDKQDEISLDHQRKTSGLFMHEHRSPCSFLESLLTGEMTAQMYQEIDRQLCKNEQLIRNKMKLD